MSSRELECEHSGHLCGQRHRLPSRAWHPGHSRIGRHIQFLGQRRSHQVEIVRNHGAIDHEMLLQCARANIRIRCGLRLVQGSRILQSSKENVHFLASMLRRLETARVIEMLPLHCNTFKSFRLNRKRKHFRK